MNKIMRDLHDCSQILRSDNLCRIRSSIIIIKIKIIVIVIIIGRNMHSRSPVS
jgi:hypothetical protein